MNFSSETTPLRRRLYPLLIIVAAGAMAGRILSVQRVVEPRLSRSDPVATGGALLLPLASGDALQAAALSAAGQDTLGRADPNNYRGVWPARRPEPTPIFGSNDRSRWDTVRALVDQGTYAIGYRDLDAETGAYRDRGIVTEDGWQTIDKVLRPQVVDNMQTFYSSKPPLLATLVAGEYWLVKHGVGWSITEDRWWVVRVILLTVNWLPMVLSLVVLARLVERFGLTDWGRLFVLATGCFGTFLTTFAITLNNHSVAAWSAIFALSPALIIWYENNQAPWRFALAGFFAAFTACNELTAASFTAALGLLLLWRAPSRTLMFFAPAAALPVAGWLLTNYLAIGQLKPAYGEFGGPWYEYAGSYWASASSGATKHGIDWAAASESQATYLFHCLLGHHGFFSLTPVFLLAAAAMAYPLLFRTPSARATEGPPLLMVIVLTLDLTLLLLAFFGGFLVLVIPSRNYGGWTSGLRWLFWLTPFWLLSMIPVADWLSHRRWGRFLACALLGLSVLSVSYPAWNPWRHPWIYDFLEAENWIPY